MYSGAVGWDDYDNPVRARKFGGFGFVDGCYLYVPGSMCDIQRNELLIGKYPTRLVAVYNDTVVLFQHGENHACCLPCLANPLYNRQQRLVSQIGARDGPRSLHYSVGVNDSISA
jgi:hypothetical protein